MKTFDEALAWLLTPTYPKYACPLDGITVDHYGRLNRWVIDYCYRHGLVRQNQGQAWRYYACIKAPDGTPVIQLWWGRTYPRQAPCRIRVNPSTGGLSAGQYVALVALLCGSEKALELVRVTRIDPKIDIPDTTVDTLDRYLLVGRARKRRKVFGMVCINSRKGNAQCVFYDVGDKRGEGPGKLVRVEYRLRFKTDNAKGKVPPLFWDVMMGSYLDGNIFERVSLANTDVLDRRTREGKLVAVHGATKAYLSLAPKARERFKKQVVMKPALEQRSLAEVFAWEAEHWHETLECMGTWLVKIDRFLDGGAKTQRHRRAVS